MLRADVLWFAEKMESKLDENLHKGGWEDSESAYLVRRLLEETGELIGAILDGEPDDTIIAEAADVANFCMMIADTAHTRNGSDIS
jgi:NTP pyrophosphatase (non-canonical NTP hydrolase)